MNVVAAFFGGLFGAVGLGSIGNLLWARRDTAAFARMKRREQPADGRLVVAAGPIRPLGAPLTSPLGGQPCVAYEYEVYSRRSDSDGRPIKSCDVVGFGMAASAIDTPLGAVRLLGFPLLDEFPQATLASSASEERARQYTATTAFADMHGGLGPAKMAAALDDAISDADGMVRKDFRLSAGDIPIGDRTLGERVGGVGSRCARWAGTTRRSVRSCQPARRSIACGRGQQPRSAARLSRRLVRRR